MTRVDRRAALRLMGAAGAGLVLTACGGDDKDDDAVAPTTTERASDADTATRVPSETGGPFPGDGTNGPNVLTEDGVVRSDITKSFGEYSGSASGTPLKVELKIVRAGSGAAFSGAALYLWHCTADGLYSLYSDGATDQNFLRGVQAADDDGNLAFKTVFPGCYPGRWPHFHYEVFPSLSAASAAKRLLTSQIAIPEEPCAAVYADERTYSDSAESLRELSLQGDGVFRDSYQDQLGAVSGNRSSGYTLTYTVVV